MLFLHGLGGNLTAWNSQREYFEKLGYQTIAIDLRGHGLSDRPKDRNEYTPEIMANDILQFIEKFKLENFVLVGHCLGGVISIILTGQYKVKPQALVLLAATYEFPPYAALIQRSKILELSSNALNQIPLQLGRPGHMPMEKFHHTNDIDPKRFLSDIFYTTAQSYISICSNLFLFNGRKLLKNITCPTLIIHGEKDTFFHPKMAIAMHKYIKHSELVLMPNANHVLVLNNAVELNHIIGKYLKSLKI